MILETPIHAKLSTKYLEDVASAGSLLQDSMVRDEQQLIENRIITNLVNHERQKLALSTEQGALLIRAYIVLMMFMCAMLYRTVNLSDLTSILIHVYILTDLAGMIDRYVNLREKLRNMIVDEAMLERLSQF
jgi:hypothetical protein